MGPISIFMVFCAYSAVYTLTKLSKRFYVYHTENSKGRMGSYEFFSKSIAKNQRDLLLCIIGIVFSLSVC